MIVWLNGTHGVGKTTTSELLQPLIPDSRVFDAEKVGETLMDISPGLPVTDNFQHWPPWRPLVVETARRVIDYTGGVLVMPMTVLVEKYWREISTGLAHHGIPVRHFVLHADEDTLRTRILSQHAVSPFRVSHLEPYAEAARTWLHRAAEVVDTTHLTAAQAARQIADAVNTWVPADCGVGRTQAYSWEGEMAEGGSTIVVLRGGSQDGSSTTVADGVERLLTPSEAPGLLDVYEPADELVHLRGNEEPAEIWQFAGQEPIERVTTEHGHPLPGHDIRSGQL